MFLKECQYIEKEREVIRHITDDLNFSSGDSDKSMKNKLSIIMVPLFKRAKGFLKRKI